MTESPKPLALRPREAAEALAICPRTLWRLTKEGDVPSIKLGRATLYSVAALEAWLEAKTTPRMKARP